MVLDSGRARDPVVNIVGPDSSEPYPAAARRSWAEKPFYHRSSALHQVVFLEEGAAALQARLEMIARARRSIDLEYYLFDTNHQSTRMLIQALVSKAREGIRVRILRDYTPFGSRFDPWLVAVLREAGVEVKIFNPAWDINPWQFRAHRKLLIVDGKEVITGGRNIDDSYFGLHRRKNFVDLDIWVKGEIVAVIRDSFEEFWNSKYSRPALFPRFPARADYVNSTPSQYYQDRRWYYRRMEAARARHLDPAPLEELLGRVERVAARQLNRNKGYESSDISFASDRPEGPRFHRVLSQVIFDRILESRPSIRIMAPYFLPLRTGEKIIGQLLDQGVPVEVLGNSRFSYDDLISIGHVIESFARPLVRKGMVFHGYSGRPPPGEELVRDDYHPRVNWEFHSKAAIFGRDSVMIGTYNFDPRSKFFNAETAIFIDGNPAAALEMRRLFEKLAGNSFRLGASGDYDCDNFRALSGWLRARRFGLFDAIKNLAVQAIALLASDML